MPVTLKKCNGEYCNILEEAAGIIINALVPNDPMATNTHMEPHNNRNFTQCTPSELMESIWKINPNKAPGEDGITGGILRKAWSVIEDKPVDIVNDCLRTSTFPDCWKTADIVTIKKTEDADSTSPKYYRPISLLPVMGKGLERIICTRIQNDIGNRPSERQYGFIKGKSTSDAIRDLISWHKNRTEKHKLAILLDISGAFDNLDWPVLQEDLEYLSCSIPNRHITKSYLCNMTARLNYGGVQKTIRLTKGCPQGFIFGPSLWNDTMNRLLTEHIPVRYKQRSHSGLC